MPKKLTITILLIIALVGVGVMAYQTVVSAVSANDELNKMPSSAIPESPRTTIPCVIDTSNWGTKISLYFRKANDHDLEID